jgi:DNA-binding NarL/FixJ family response regulator
MLMPMVMRCLIVDDSELFLTTAAASLAREGVAVVGTASASSDALREVERLKPDVVLVDISLGRESGFALAHRLVELFPELRARIVLISTHDGQDYADLIEASPAAGFLAKSLLSASALRALVSV